MDVGFDESRVGTRRRPGARGIAAPAEPDPAMRALTVALLLVLGAIIAAAMLARLGDFQLAASDDTGACIRLADNVACATRAELADRLLARRTPH